MSTVFRPAVALFRVTAALAAGALWVCAALVACTPEPPTATPGRYALSGRVRLTGYLVDESGRFAGTRVVDDADGVAVELIAGSVIAQTTTVDGIYRFDNLVPGAYKTRARVIGNVADESPGLTIVSWDLVAGDTLRLTSSGDLLPIPNPAADTVIVYFQMHDSLYVDMRIRDPGGATTQTLISWFMPRGVRSVLWDGRDAARNPVTGSLYWVTFESMGDARAHLLFR